MKKSELRKIIRETIEAHCMQNEAHCTESVSEMHCSEGQILMAGHCVEAHMIGQGKKDSHHEGQMLNEKENKCTKAARAGFENCDTSFVPDTDDFSSCVQDVFVEYRACKSTLGLTTLGADNPMTKGDSLYAPIPPKPMTQFDRKIGTSDGQFDPMDPTKQR